MPVSVVMEWGEYEWLMNEIKRLGNGVEYEVPGEVWADVDGVLGLLEVDLTNGKSQLEAFAQTRARIRSLYLKYSGRGDD